MDALADYGSDSSSEEEEEESRSPALLPVVPSKAVSESSCVAPAAANTSTTTDAELHAKRPRTEEDHHDAMLNQNSSNSSRHLKDNRMLPPPAVRRGEDEESLIHWSRDYLTPLQEAANQGGLYPKFHLLKTTTTREDDGMAKSLLENHDFLNPHQFEAAAVQLGVHQSSVLGSTLEEDSLDDEMTVKNTSERPS